MGPPPPAQVRLPLLVKAGFTGLEALKAKQ